MSQLNVVAICAVLQVIPYIAVAVVTWRNMNPERRKSN